MSCSGGGKKTGKKGAAGKKGPAKKTAKKGAAKKTAKKTNPWLEHVKKVRAANKGIAFKEVLKIAAKNYKK